MADFSDAAAAVCVCVGGVMALKCHGGGGCSMAKVAVCVGSYIIKMRCKFWAFTAQ
jgi:hypothetical protein